MVDGSSLELRVTRAADGHLVEAELGDGAYFGPEPLVVDAAALLALAADPDAEGRALFGLLFRGVVQDAWVQALATARAQAEDGDAPRLHVRLQLDRDASPLQALRWERLQIPMDGTWLPLSASPLTPFARLMPLSTPAPRPVRVRPVRMLVVVANPTGLPERSTAVPVEEELRSLRQVLGPAVQAGALSVTLAPGRTGVSAEVAAELEAAGFSIHPGPTRLADIRKLVAGRHIVHFVGHGSFRASPTGGGESALFLEDATGALDVVTEDRLRLAFSGLGDPPALVVLMACQSASMNADQVHPLVGLAPQLVRMGVPAVIAMQDVLPMAATRVLTEELYGALLDHGQVDVALNQARAALSTGTSADWATPVLFTRLAGGRLLAGRAVEHPAPVVASAPPRRRDRLRSAIRRRPWLLALPVAAVLLAVVLGLVVARSLRSETDVLVELARAAGIEDVRTCRPWTREAERNADPSAFDHGAVGAVQCDLGGEMKQVALYRFRDRGALEAWWALKVYSRTLSRDTGDCSAGLAGEQDHEVGRVACWVTPGLARLRWLDDGALLYGLVDGRRTAAERDATTTAPGDATTPDPSPGAESSPGLDPSAPAADPGIVRTWSWWQTYADRLR
jgi:hypothetical protein